MYFAVMFRHLIATVVLRTKSHSHWLAIACDFRCVKIRTVAPHHQLDSICLFDWVDYPNQCIRCLIWHFGLNTKIWMRKCENCSWHLNSRPNPELLCALLNKCLFYLMRIDVFYSVHFPAEYLIALNSEMYTVAQLQFAKSHNKPRYFLNCLFTLHKFKFEFPSDALRQLFTFRQFDSSIGRKRNCMREIVCNYPSEIGTLNFMSYAGKR